ncbi:MAG: hypothetical protein MMC33_001692 [Icmadophila ericetorum]|nr:hypothetical protein [Icmadophila ericetorum]
MEKAKQQIQNKDFDGLIHDARVSMKNFDFDAILRGAQLTVVGGTSYRALQNPKLFTNEHYRQAAVAVFAGVLIRLLIAAPIVLIKILLWGTSFFVDFEAATWDDKLVGGLDFLANSVLQIPFFLMSLMRYITPTLDHMFMDSLKWVDETYVQKHKSEDPQTLRAMYYPNLSLYPAHGHTHTGQHTKPQKAILAFFIRFGRRAGISLAIFFLSYLPVVGKLVLPAASFYTFNKAVGPVPATVIFGTGVILPRRYLIVFLQSYFASRSLMRELLEPYFSRIQFTKEQKRRWFHDREGLLFGFGVGFYIFLKIPLLGVLIYGIAEASTAYLITKVTDPPPPPTESEKFAESQIRWTNKREFLHLPLANLDAHNIKTEDRNQYPVRTELPSEEGFVIKEPVVKSAAKTRSTEVLDLLLKHRWDIDDRWHGMAIHRDDIGFVHWFIDHMASFNLRPNGCKSNTPLTEAVIYASIDIVHLLVLTAFAWARATNYIPFQSIFNHIAMMSSPSSSRRVHRSTSSRMSTTRAGSRSRSSLA